MRHDRGKKPPQDRESKRSVKEDRLSDAKARVDSLAHARQRRKEERALETALDPELMYATYGPDWRRIVAEASLGDHHHYYEGREDPEAA
jgi:hypothetical protein